MQEEKYSLLKSIEDMQRQELEKKRNSIILTIEIVQFESPTPLPILINYYISPSNNPFSETKLFSIYENYLCTKTIYDHLKKFDSDFDFSILTKESIGFSLNNYDFRTPIHFRGIVSKTIPSDLDTNTVKEYHQAFYSSFFGTNAYNQSIGFNSFFQNKVEISGVFIKALDFRNSHFDNQVELQNLSIRKGIGFANCRFNKCFAIFAIKLESETFLDFSHSIFFDNANFSSTQFFGAIRFHRSIFMNKALFYDSKFLDTANFYFATFVQPPSFSMSVFKDSKLAHFTGVDISHLTLEVLKTNIQEKAQEEKSEENNFMGRGIAYLQIQHAINLQDSFRVIKETLNAQSNNLESQKWHKLELYAKELELGYRGEIKNLEKDTKTFEDTAKQDVINNKKSKGLYIPHIKQNDSAQILEINKRERLRNTIDRIQLWFYRHTSDHHTDLLKIASWVLVAIGCFGVLYLGTRVLQDASIITKLNPYGLALSFTGAILALPFCTTAQKPFFEFRRYLTILSSITTLWIACYKPILIFGAINLIDRSPRLGLENLLLVLYTLAMILLLFSLQKTARKNSIIPS